MENIKQWQTKLPGIEPNTIAGWIKNGAILGLTKQQLEEYVMDQYSISQGRAERTAIDQKWSNPPKPIPEPGFDKSLKKALKSLTKTDEEPDEDLEELDESLEEELDEDLPEDYDEAEEIFTEEDEGDSETKLIDAPEAEKPEPYDPIPYKNPDLNQFNGAKEPDPTPSMPIKEIPSQASMFTDMLKRRLQQQQTREEDDEFIHQTISPETFEEAIKPYKTFIIRTKNEPNLLIDFARSVDLYNHPPYIQVRHFIINNSIKDPANFKILLNVYDEEHPERTIKRHTPLTQAWDITRRLVEEGYYQSGILNYDSILEQVLTVYIPALVANIVILEIYCESRKMSPLEITIPKAQLLSSVMKAFTDIESLIKQQMIRELSLLRQDLQGQLGDVSGIVETNFSKMDAQIKETVERVIWKVKTDIEATNLEDIKKVDLHLINKSSSTYQLGTRAVAILAVLQNDARKMLINKNYKTEEIKEYRRYTITEIQKVLGYSSPTDITKGVFKLARHGLIKLYSDKTFQLLK